MTIKNRALQISALSGLLLVAFGCQRMPDMQENVAPQYHAGDELTFTATMEGGADTRTVLDGTRVMWNPTESINIFYGPSESGSRFVSTNTEPALSASFSGTISAFTATTETGQALSFWAVYPYNGSASCSGTSVSSSLPSEQTGVSGNIPDNAMMMVAESPGLALSFKQVCSRLRLRISHPDICRIVFSGNAGEVVAGGAEISLDGSGNPVWTSIAGQEATEIELVPDGAHFEEGSEYYLVLYPQNFVDGVTIKYYRDELYGEHNFTEALEFPRAGRNTFKSSEVTEWTARTTQLPNEIWYTSTDGKAVEYTVDGSTGNEVISNTYADGRGVIRFASDVKVIDADAFRAGIMLASVTLPEKVETIGNSAFCGCTNLAEVNMGDRVRTIEEYAFYDCAFPQIHLSESLYAIGESAFAFNHCLEEVHMPESVTILGLTENHPFYFYNNIFTACTSLRKFTGKFATEDGLCLLTGNGAGRKDALVSVALGGISGTFRVPDGVEVLVRNVFDQAPVTSVDLNGVSVIYDYAFRGSSLQSITIPSTVERIRESAFSHCNDMTDMWFESAPLPRLDENALGRLDDEETDFTIHIPGIANARSGGALLYETYSIEVDGQTQQIHSYWYDYRMETERVEVYQPDDEIWYHKSGNDLYFNYYSMNFGTAASPVKETLFGPFYMTDYPRFTANADVPGGSEFEWIGVLKFDGPVTSIPERAFYSKTEMDWISLPSTVEAIHDEAFTFCSALTFIKGDNVTFLGASAFTGCTLLSGFNFSKVENVQACCFMDCGNLYVASLPQAWFIGGSAFRGCNKLMVVTLAAIQTIGNQAFAYTRNMYVMILGPNLASVGDLVFYDDDASLRNSGKLQILFFGNPAPEISDPQDAAWTWTDAFAYEVAGQAPYFQFREIGISSTLWDEWDANGNLDDFQQMVEAHFGGSSIIVPKEVE